MPSLQVNDTKIAANQKQNTRNALFIPIAICAFLLTGGTIAVLLSQQFSSNTPQQAEQLPKEPNELPTATREEVQKPLSELKNRIESLKSKAAKFAWKESESVGMVEMLDSMYLNYAAGEYGSVKSDIVALRQSLDDYDQQYQNAYEETHKQAQQLFDEETIPESTLANQNTLDINPDFEPAVTLQKRISVYDTVKSIQKDIARAEAERNLDDQHALLKRLISIDPLRTVEQQKYNIVSEQIKNREFAETVKNAYQELDKDNLNKASRLLQKARSLKSSSPELPPLEEQINLAVANKKLQSLHDKVRKLREEDKWQNVINLAQQGLHEFPNDTLMQGSLRLAKDIVDAKGLLQIYIDKPERVYDDNIRKIVPEDLAEVSGLKNQSTSLDNMITQVEKNLDIANTRVKVWFQSDDRTYIRVLRVGQVGETDGRYVELLPGIHQVEGSRKGYKNKLVTLVVKPGENNRITVICDEKL